MKILHPNRGVAGFRRAAEWSGGSSAAAQPLQKLRKQELLIRTCVFQPAQRTYLRFSTMFTPSKTRLLPSRSGSERDCLARCGALCCKRLLAGRRVCQTRAGATKR